MTSRITGEGSVHISPEQEDYLRETEITLTATPEPGFAFVRWIGQVTGSANPLEFPIRRNSLVTAIFEPAETTYLLEIDTLGSGTVEVSPEGSEFTAGTDVTLTPKPDAGFVFHRWTGAAGGSAVPLVINMDSAKAITAEFVSNQSYERWTLDHFGALASDESIAGRMADPDGDGRVNSEEFALVSDPNQAHSMPQVSTSLVPIGGKPYFTLSWQQRSAAVITPEVAADLIGFAPATVTTISEEPVEGTTGIIAKSIRLSEPITHSWRGMRLKIDLP